MLITVTTKKKILPSGLIADAILIRIVHKMTTWGFVSSQPLFLLHMHAGGIGPNDTTMQSKPQLRRLESKPTCAAYPVYPVS